VTTRRDHHPLQRPGLGVLAATTIRPPTTTSFTNTRTVGRVTAGVEANQAVALLLLERTTAGFSMSAAERVHQGRRLRRGTGPHPRDSLGNGSSCNNAKIFDSNNNPLVGISARKAETGAYQDRSRQPP
jgi:hypothetical protein